MQSKRLVRAWSAIRVRYPIFQAIRVHQRSFVTIGLIYMATLLYSVLWAYEVPQSLLSIRPLTGIPDNFFSTVIEFSALLLLGAGLLLWKTIAASENTRINNNYNEIPDALVLPFNPGSRVEMCFDSNSYYSRPPILEACLRWVEFDKDEYFLVEAGSLDIPKVALKTVTVNPASETVRLELGYCSYFDCFYTHYSPDMVLSSQSATESNEAISLRSLFGESVFKYYSRQIEAGGEDNAIECSSLVPNPLGVSGIVLLSSEFATYVVLRKRGNHEIAARNRLEWSFAGLVEAAEWLHESKIDFEHFVQAELADEVVGKAPRLAAFNPEIRPLGMVFNPLYLYQPEIFAVVWYEQMDSEMIKSLQASLGDSFLLVTTEQLPDAFRAHTLKNLCLPGLKLLQTAYPQLFSK